MVVNAALIRRERSSVHFDKLVALPGDKLKNRRRMFVALQQGGTGPRTDAVVFTREELSSILNLYGSFVTAGEWRDYAVDHLRDGAVFSVFRHAAETPLYRIEKRPREAKQGVYAVVSMTGVILKRGHDLAQVLRLFDRRKLRLAK